MEPTVDTDDEFQSDPLASSSGQPAHRIFGKTPAEDIEMRDERKRSREEEEHEYEEAGSSTKRRQQLISAMELDWSTMMKALWMWRGGKAFWKAGLRI